MDDMTSSAFPMLSRPSTPGLASPSVCLITAVQENA
jgi:hypothetical protein